MNAAYNYSGQDLAGSVALEALDIGLDETQLKQLSQVLKLLGQYAASFDDQRAVCQAQVKQLVEECEITLDQRYPLASFTKAPSPQNLSVVTESVMGRAGQVLVELANKVWEVIVKMLRWVIDAFKHLAKRERKIAKRVELVRHLHQANTEVKHLSGGAVSDEDAEALHAAHEKLLEAEENYQTHLTALGMELLSEGKFVAAIKAIALNMAKMVDLTERKANEVVRSLQTLKKLGHVVPNDIAQVAEPLPIIAGLKVAQNNWNALANADTWPDLMLRFKEATDQLHADDPKGVMEWKIAAAVVVSPRSALAEPLVPIPDLIWKYVEKMEAEINNFRQLDFVKAVDPKYAALVESMFTSLTADLHALIDYGQAANLALDSQAFIVDAIYRCEAAEFELARLEVRASRNPTAVEKLNEIQRNLHSKIILREGQDD
jgi:hypothetical protein